MKKFASKIKPLYLVPVVVIAALVVAGVFVFGGDGDDAPKQPDAAAGIGEGDASQLPGSKRKPPKQAPVVRTGVLDEARRVGRLAVAQARGTIVTPSRVRIRVSAAPKQVVTVNYQLGCYGDRRARVGKGSYRTRPPDIRAVEIPMANPERCIVTAGAQLTKNEGVGRIKVAVIAGG